MEIIM